MHRALALLLPLTVLAPAASVSAHARGIDVAECSGCHSGGREPDVRIVAMPADPDPGDVVRLRIEIEAINGPAGGFHLRSSGPGAFRTVAGEGTRLASEDVVVHDTPGTASGGLVTFEIDWLAPSTPGDVQLRVGAMSANGDRTSRGDLGGSATLGLVYGCTGITAYPDHDRDGVGASSRGSLVVCAITDGISASGDDCDDNDGMRYPGATERCDAHDDDCDGEVDEELGSTISYPDGDGDGYGGPTGDPVDGCGRPGYGVGNRDCDDRDPAIHPDATEVCDGRDGDCDGDVDERVRPQCGVGWCRREAPTCDESTCEPGEPRDEMCNAFDDDCDGAADEEGDLCSGGEVCEAGRCGGAVVRDDAGRPIRPEPTTGGCAISRAARGAGALLGLVLTVAALALLARRRR